MRTFTKPYLELLNLLLRAEYFSKINAHKEVEKILSQIDEKIGDMHHAILLYKILHTVYNSNDEELYEKSK